MTTLGSLNCICNNRAKKKINLAWWKSNVLINKNYYRIENNCPFQKLSNFQELTAKKWVYSIVLLNYHKILLSLACHTIAILNSNKLLEKIYRNRTATTFRSIFLSVWRYIYNHLKKLLNSLKGNLKIYPIYMYIYPKKFIPYSRLFRCQPTSSRLLPRNRQQ